MRAKSIYEQLVEMGRITPQVAQQRIIANMNRCNKLLSFCIEAHDIRGIIGYSAEIEKSKNDLISLHQYIMAKSDQVTNN